MTTDKWRGAASSNWEDSQHTQIVAVGRIVAVVGIAGTRSPHIVVVDVVVVAESTVGRRPFEAVVGKRAEKTVAELVDDTWAPEWP